MKEFIYSLEIVNNSLTPVNKGEIIRCRDCKYFQHINGYDDSGDYVCERQPKYNEYGEVNMLVVYPDDFCSRAERKETE